MNISSGIYRLAQVIKWIGRVLGGIWIIGFVYGALTGSGKSGLGFIFVLVLVFIVITEGISWILEGFASE